VIEKEHFYDRPPCSAGEPQFKEMRRICYYNLIQMETPLLLPNSSPQTTFPELYHGNVLPYCGDKGK
jgi:hypothetical protein